MPSPRTIAVLNQKGGVGKTTITLCVAAAAANAGKRVLVIDMDPQTNASRTLLPDYDEQYAAGTLFTVNDLMEEKGVEASDVVDAITPSAWPGVDVIASSQSLADREVEGTKYIDTRFRQRMPGIPDCYDLILFDCPPSLGRLTGNAMTSVREILLVTEATEFGLRALDQFEETMRITRANVDNPPEVLGVVVNKYENTREATARLADIQRHGTEPLLMVMPKRTLLAEAMSARESVFSMRHRNAPAVAHWFSQLAVRLGLVAADEVPHVDEASAVSDGPIGALLVSGA